ncbi:unnamed protein product, partial [Rotaria sordida]
MNRYNEYPSENAGARLLLEVRKLGFDCHCLVFTQDAKASASKIEQLLDATQREN